MQKKKKSKFPEELSKVLIYLKIILQEYRLVNPEIIKAAIVVIDTPISVRDLGEFFIGHLLLATILVVLEPPKSLFEDVNPEVENRGYQQRACHHA